MSTFTIKDRVLNIPNPNIVVYKSLKCQKTLVKKVKKIFVVNFPPSTNERTKKKGSFYEFTVCENFRVGNSCCDVNYLACSSLEQVAFG